MSKSGSGNNGNNTIVGTDHTDIINGGSGNDVIDGVGGHDLLLGGNGDDVVLGGLGNDLLFGGNGDDTLNGGDGHDLVDGGNGDDVLLGGAGTDLLLGGNGDDTIDGGGGSDIVLADKGNDTVIYVVSENSNDSDFYDGGKGHDTLKLVLTQSEFDDPDIQADIAAFQAFLAGNHHYGIFHFTAFDLTVRDFEALEIELVGGNEIAPVATDDAAAAGEDSAVTFAVLANDDDPDGNNANLFVASYDDSGLQGALTLNPDNTFTYDPGVAFQHLAEGETAQESFTYIVEDEQGLTSTATVVITVTGTNDAPIITSGVQSASVSEVADSAAGENIVTHSTNGAVTFVDLDASDTHTASFAAHGSGYLGTFSLGAVNQAADSVDWTFSVADSPLDSLAAGQTLTQSYDVTVSDGNGGAATQTVTITVTGTNDAPVLADTTLYRASVTQSGQQSNGFTGMSVISPDGTVVAFHSNAANLTPSDTDFDLDVIAKDMLSGAVSRVSTNQAGDHVNDDVDANTPWAISADNNLVLFTSDQALSPDDNSQSGGGPAGADQSDVYIKNLSTGAVTLVNTDQAGVHRIDLNAEKADMSADGTVVAFTTSDFSFTPGDGHVMVKDLVTGELIEVDRAADGTLANQSANTETIGVSADGKMVMFASRATNLVPGFSNGSFDAVYVKNIETGAIVLATSAADGTPANSGNYAITGSMSANGRYVSFTSDATNLIPDGVTGGHVYVKDLVTGAVVRASAAENGNAADAPAFDSQLSGDGRFITFRSNASNLVSGDTNGRDDVFVKDLQTGAIARITPNAVDAMNFLAMGDIGISDDGNYIVFSTWQSLVPGDTNNTRDVFYVANPLLNPNDTTGAVAEMVVPSGSLTDSGSIAFVDVDLTDAHSATATPIGSTLGTLNVAIDSDTTGSGTGGLLTWAYSVDASAVEALAAAEQRIESFNVVVDDGHGGTAARQIDVTITGTNDVPVVSAAVTGGGTEGSGTATVDLLEFASDVDNGAVLHVENLVWDEVPGNMPAGFSLVGNSLTVDTDNLAYNGMAQGETFTTHFTYDVVDEYGVSATQHAIITLTGTNDGPLVSAAVTGGGAEGSGTATVNLLDFASDIDNGAVLHVENLSWDEVPGNMPAGFSLVGSTLTVDTDSLAYNGLAQGETFTTHFTYSVVDEHGASTTQHATITITGTNDGPVAIADGNAADPVIEAGVQPGNAPFAGDATATGNVLGNDIEYDGTDNLIVTTTGIFEGTYGTLTLAADGQWTYTLDNFDADTNALSQDQSASETFGYSVVDQHGAVASSTLSIEITGTNDLPNGSDVLVSQRNVSEQEANVVVGLSDGRFLAVWNSFDPSGMGIEARFFNADGSASSDEFSLGGQYSPDVAQLSGGAVVVAYVSGGAIHGRILNTDGSLSGGEFQINQNAAGLTSSGDGTPSVTALDNNRFLVSWVSNDNTTGDNSGTGIVARIFEFNGSAVPETAEFRVNNTTLGNQSQVSAAALVGGGAVLVWRDGSSPADIRGARLDSDGNSLGEFLIPTNSAGFESDPVVAALPDGGFVVAWDADAILNVRPDSIWLRQYDAGGNAVREFQVNTEDAGVRSPAIAALPDGRFLVTWTFQGAANGDSSGGVAGQWYGSNGQAIGGEFLINTAAAGFQGNQDLDVLEDGRVVVVFNSRDPLLGDASGGNSAARIVVPPDVNAVSEDGTFTVVGNVLANDTDVDALDTHSVSAVNGSAANVGTDVVGSYGTLHLASDGSYTYTLANGQPGVQALAEGERVLDIFSYTNLDNNGASAVSQLAVTITGTNDGPVAVADTNAGDAVTEAGVSPGNTPDAGDPSAVGNVLANDSDVDNGATLTVTTVGAFVGTYGTLTLQANGDWTYVLNSLDGDTNALAQGESVSDVFDYSIEDEHGAVSASTLTIDINGTNDKPVIVGTTSGTVVEDTTPTVSGDLDAIDPDHGAQHTWTVVGGAPSESADFVFHLDSLQITRNGNTSFFFDDFNDSSPPPDGPNGDPSYILGNGVTVPEAGGRAVLAASGGILGIAPGTPDPFITTNAVVRTNIDPANLAAGLKIDDNFKVEATFDLAVPDDNREAYGVRLRDRLVGSDGNPPDQLGDDVIELMVLRGPDGVTRVQLREKDFVADEVNIIQATLLNPPAGADQILLRLSHAANTGNVVASFNYLAGGVVVGTHTFASTAQIFGTETPGTADDENWTRAEVIAWSPEVTASTLSGAYGTLSIEQNGSWTYSLNNSLSAVQALAEGETAVDTFQVMVADEHGATDTATINVTVTGANDAPSLITGDASRSLTEDGSSPDLTATGLAFFNDVDLIDTHTLNVSLASAMLSGGGVLPPALDAALQAAVTTQLLDPATGDGAGQYQWDFALDNGLVQFVGAGETLTAVYEIAVTDNHNASAIQQVTVTIMGTNDAPELALDTFNFAIAENEPVNSFVGQALAADVDSGDVLRYSINGTDSAFFSIDEMTGAITANQSFDFEADSSFSFSVEARDRETGGLTDTAAVNVNVGNVADTSTQVLLDFTSVPVHSTFSNWLIYHTAAIEDGFIVEDLDRIGIEMLEFTSNAPQATGNQYNGSGVMVAPAGGIERMSVKKQDGGEFSAHSIDLDWGFASQSGNVTLTAVYQDQTTFTDTVFLPAGGGLSTIDLGVAFQDIVELQFAPTTVQNLQFDNVALSYLDLV